jgi:hypothetical protein
MTDPRAEVTRRLEAWRGAAARAGRDDARAALLRLLVFLAALAGGWAVVSGPRLPAAWLLLPGAAFLALVGWHDRVLAGQARARRAIAFHEGALARLDGRFAGQGVPGDRFADPAHRYALDLDLFGPGSVFELICAARTRPGEERLAAWLLAPAGAEEVRARQRAVTELAPRLELREALALLGDEVRAGVDAAHLAAWGREPPLLPRAVAPAALGLVALALAAGLAWAAGLAGPLPFAAALAAEGILGRLLQGRVARVLGGLDRPVAELRVLSLLLARLEAEPLEGARLRELQAALRGPGAPASARIARLAALAARLESARNQLFAPVAFLLSWRPLHAVAVERWRRRSGAAVARWLDAVAELEALTSLAGHAFEHPDHVAPELVDPGAGGALLEGEALRHPLLAGAVPNDVRLGGAGPRLLLVSGSNMSGKSTYLRTVGVGVVLALCGARVPARRLRLTPLQLGATLRIQDSLLAGRSRFYAEISRLKALVDLAAGAPPLLALLDEILHGTNSHDRRVGAEAVLAALLARGAMGLVTTHDLALTGLARPGVVANAHFEDQVRDGALAFDYRLRQGVVEHSNALALMRAVGLEV